MVVAFQQRDPKREASSAMRTHLITGLLFVAACAPTVPDSNPSTNGGGVGFGGYDDYMEMRRAREAELSRSGEPAMESPSPVPESQAIASETLGVLRSTSPGTQNAPNEVQTATIAARTPAAVETQTITPRQIETVSASNQMSAGAAEAGAPLAAPGMFANNPTISDEQSFDAVSSRETIASDAERLERNRELYTLVQPEALPERPGGGGPNIVAYALATTNTVGQPLYSRSRPSQERFSRACAAYPSPDRAQEAFLENGGPERDRQGMDPDGDGFACYWDPRPFRAARRGG